MVVADAPLEVLESGLDALEFSRVAAPPRWRRVVTVALPKVCAVVVLIGAWQLVVSLGMKPTYVIPPPLDVWHDFTDLLGTGQITEMIWTSLRRGVVGYLAAIAIGTPLGLLIARVRFVRLAIGSLVAGLQTLPSVVWVIPGVIWFGLTETTIYLVVILGAVPSVAQGVVSALDSQPPLLLRVGRSMGARGVALYWHIILPGALPGYLAGLKQAWSFSWRSLMAAEIITQSPDLGFGLGQQLNNAQVQSDMTLALMAILLILVVGVAVDSLVFAPLDRAVRRRRGLEAA
ncbi:MAG TPA: ABC transporter permease [Candidatus Dormibacteraeota bacterium]